MLKKSRQAEQKKTISLRQQTMSIIVMIGISVFFLCARSLKDESPKSFPNFIAFEKDSQLVYMIHIDPHEKSKLLYKWTVGIKELSSGKIVSRQTALTMRGQENELQLKYRTDNSRIKMIFHVHTTKQELHYNIKRTRGDKQVFWCKGVSRPDDKKK
jgi:hypothetical protein